MKFVFLVEGHTERKSIPEFIKRWLEPQLTQRVGIKAFRFDGWPEFAKKAVGKARNYLAGPDSNEIIAVIGLLDLQGPDFYPADKTSVPDRYRWAVSKFEKEVGHAKFRMFYAVHDIEAWLISQPGIFPEEIGKALAQKVGSPEAINFDEPPGKLLGKLYREKLRKDYKKAVYGPGLFAKLDCSVAYQKCPYLRTILDEMLSLAQGAGL